MTEDSRNTSVFKGANSDTAPLSFEFEKKPGGDAAPDIKEKSAKNKTAKNKASSKSNNKAKTEQDAKASEAKKTEKLPKPEEAKDDNVKKASDNVKKASEKADSSEKEYGLPADYNDKKNEGPEAKAESKASDANEESNGESSFKAFADSLKIKISEKSKAAKLALAKMSADKKQQAEERAEERRRIREGEALAKSLEKSQKANSGASEEDTSSAAIKKSNMQAAKKSKSKTEDKKPAEKKKSDDKKKASASDSGKSQKSQKKPSKAKSSLSSWNSKGGKTVNKKLKGSGQKKKKKKQKKERSKAVRWTLAAVKIILVLGILGFITGSGYIAYTVANAEEIQPDKLYNLLDVSTHVYDDDGVLIDDLYYSENREISKYEELPENLKNAFIAVEDKTFWEHRGFNFRRIFGAIWNSVTGGGEISGTSTITQQLARNVYLPEEKSVRSIKRKIIEMYYAHEIEEVLSKEEILTAYLNTIYLGYGCYGVDIAARKYFSCKVEDLSLEQSAALAALPQAPGIYALVVGEEGEATTKLADGVYANDISRQRRDMILDLMAEQQYISAEEAEAAKKPLTDFIKLGKDYSGTMSAFKDYLIETVTKDLMNQYGLTEAQATNMIYAKGLNIYSTLDTQAQKVIVKEFKEKNNFPKAIKDNAKVESSMVIVEVGTGQIKAMAGTRNADGEKLFNRAVSPRQPGSSIKPIAVYAPALQKSFEYQKEGKKFPFKDTGYDTQGKRNWGDYITALSTVRDEKMTVNGKTWPQNFSRSYSGYKNFRTAIQQSINTCAVKILAQIGTDYSMEMIKKFGITTAIDDTSKPINDVNLAALGLGAMSEGVTPLEMALAYATFPNGGVRNSGICYTKVTDSEGNVLLEGKSEKTKVLDPGVAFIMTDVLKSVVSDGIAFNAKISGEEVGGKTGTTDETWDIWFDGFTPKYAAALWIGTDDNTELDTTSATAAALWSDIMKQVKGAKGGSYKKKPDNVILKNGEYYTNGTQPPDPPPKKKEDDKDKNKTDDKKTEDKKDDGKKD